MNVVLNAGPLIYLGKKRRINLVKLVFQKILIPPEVEEEIMKINKSPEAVQLRDAIHEKWIAVERPSEKRVEQIARLFPEIDEGEAAVIALAVEHGWENVLIDDAEARMASEYFKLKVFGTLYVLLEAYKRKIFKSKLEVKSLLDNMLRKGFYLSTEVYAKFLFLLEKIK